MTNFLSFQVHGNADHSIAAVEMIESLLAYLGRIVEKPPLEIFQSVMPGIASLQNIHPVFVHFPIAFLTGFFLLDVIGAFSYKNHWRQAATWFLYFGTVTAAITAAAGFLAAETVAHGDNVHDIMERHELYGFTILGLSVGLSLWRSQLKSLVCDVLNSAFMMLSTVLWIFIVLAADLGGLMVYGYGVSVAGVQQESHNHQHSSASEESSSADEQDNHSHTHSHDGASSH